VYDVEVVHTKGTGALAEAAGEQAGYRRLRWRWGGISWAGIKGGQRRGENVHLQERFLREFVRRLLRADGSSLGVQRSLCHKGAFEHLGNSRRQTRALLELLYRDIRERSGPEFARQLDLVGQKLPVVLDRRAQV